MIVIPTSISFSIALDAGGGQGVAVGILAWLLFWMVPAALSLPVIRSIAEAEEHDYDRGDTVFDTTFSNNDFWHQVLFHPAGDAFHLVHHLYPNIPLRENRKVHRFLMKNHSKYQVALHRTRVMEQV